MCITQPPKPPDLDATTWHAIGALEITPGGSRYPRTSCHNHKHHVQNHKLGSPPALLGAFVWRLGWEDTWTKLLLQGTPDAETAYEVGPSGSRPDKLCLLRTDGRTGASRSSLAAGAHITVSFTLLSYNGNRHVNPKFYKIFYRRCSVPTSS